MNKLAVGKTVSAILMFILVILLSIAVASAQPSYFITDLGTLGGTNSLAAAINNSGQVAGSSDTSSPFSHAFLYSGGAMQDLGTLGGEDSQAYGINNSGQVAGTSFLSDNFTQHAFLYSGGTMQDIGTLGGTFSQAYGINDSGQVVGWAQLSTNAAGQTAYHAFLYSGGIMQDLGTLGGEDSQAYGINNLGQVAGTADITYSIRVDAFLYSGGIMQDLGTLGGGNSVAFGINNSGHVVGQAYITYNATHAFLYSGGPMQDLGTLGGASSWALGINNSGQVVGTSFLSDNITVHAFLYTGGTMQDLNNLIPSSSGWVLEGAYGINDYGQIAGYGLINGSTHAFLATPGWEVPVTTGTNVAAVLGPQVELIFSNVGSTGTVTAALALPGAMPPPVNFSLLGGTSSYDITTTAGFTGNVEVCITYNPTQITIPAQDLELFHYSGGVWTNITSFVDTVHDMVCGQTSSFSIFAVGKPIYTQEPLSIRSAAVQFWNKQDTMGNVLVWADFKVPMPSANDIITGTFGPITLFSAPFSEFKRGLLPNLYWYEKKGDTVWIDFKLGQIFVLTPKIPLTGLNYSNSVEVGFTISGPNVMEIGYQNITMTQGPWNTLVYIQE